MRTKAARRLAYLRQKAEHERSRGREDQAAAYDHSAERVRADLRAQRRCEDCGHVLEYPTSIARGVGPDCWAKRRKAAA